MAYNKAGAENAWLQWKEAEEQRMRQAETIQQIRLSDWEQFKAGRRYYERLQETDTYIDQQAANEPVRLIRSVEQLLDGIESEEMYQALLTVGKPTLQIVLYKMEGYSPHKIAVLLHLSDKGVYKRLDRLKEKSKNFCGQGKIRISQRLWGERTKSLHPSLCKR